MAEKFDIEFDVVVAGAGSAGCVLATRLTENPAISLCLIEAGGRDRNPWIHVPLGFGKLVANPEVNWGYETEPEPHLNGRRLSWPRGKAIVATASPAVDKNSRRVIFMSVSYHGLHGSKSGFYSV